MLAIKLLLLHAHTHAGRAYAAGAVIEVDATTASWLAAHGVGEPVSHTPPPQSMPAAGEPAAATTRTRRFYPPRTAESHTHGDDHER